MRRTIGLWAAACAVTAGAAAAADAPRPGDPVGPVTNDEFVMKAANGGMYEIKSSEMALLMATDPRVKKFAERMIADHGKAKEGLMAAAKAAQIAVPPKPDEKHQKMLDDLKGVPAAQFDRAYMAAQEKAHDKVVGLFRSAGKSVTDPGLKAFAEKTLPTLEEHHKMARELRDALAAP